MSAPVYFIRHGETDWNAAERLQGQADTDLNEVGRAQARRNGATLAALEPDLSGFRFVASPMRRTRETVEIVRAAAGLDRSGYDLDPRLIEVHFGDWQGMTLAEVEAAVPGSRAARAADKWNFVPPGDDAESYERLAARFAPVLEELKHPTVCVAHGGIIRAVFRLLGGLDANAAAQLRVPQDRILRWRDGALAWL